MATGLMTAPEARPARLRATPPVEGELTLPDRRTLFVKERVGVMKLTDTFDLLDPETQQGIGVACEEPSAWSKYLRLVVNKRLLPTTVRVYEQEGGPALLTLDKSFAFFGGNVTVRDAQGRTIGCLKTKLWSFGGGFWVHDADDHRVAEVRGDWKGWNFTLKSAQGAEFGTVTKKWAGIGKELFTSADNYVISFSDEMEGQPALLMLLLAASLAIDMIFKERK